MREKLLVQPEQKKEQEEQKLDEGEDEDGGEELTPDAKVDGLESHDGLKKRMR